MRTPFFIGALLLAACGKEGDFSVSLPGSNGVQSHWESFEPGTNRGSGDGWLPNAERRYFQQRSEWPEADWREFLYPETRQYQPDMLQPGRMWI